MCTGNFLFISKHYQQARFSLCLKSLWFVKAYQNTFKIKEILQRNWWVILHTFTAQVSDKTLQENVLFSNDWDKC